MAQDRAHLWRAPGLGNTLFLKAAYRTQRFDRHFHDGFAIGVIDSGCQAFTYDSNTRCDMPTGSIALIAPGVVHEGWPGIDDGWRYRMLYPSTGLVDAAVCDIFGPGELPTFHRPVVTDPELASALDALHSASALASSDSLELEARFLSAIRLAFERYAGRRAAAEPALGGRQIKGMREMIEENFGATITLQMLGDLAGISRFSVLRHFKSAFGLTPYAFLRHVRVRRAHEMILSGNTLAEVAVAVGFADQAHMTRIFRQTVGYTPGVLAGA